jgi:hypothetical protein
MLIQLFHSTQMETTLKVCWNWTPDSVFLFYYITIQVAIKLYFFKEQNIFQTILSLQCLRPCQLSSTRSCQLSGMLKFETLLVYSCMRNKSSSNILKARIYAYLASGWNSNIGLRETMAFGYTKNCWHLEKRLLKIYHLLVQCEMVALIRGRWWVNVPSSSAYYPTYVNQKSKFVLPIS